MTPADLIAIIKLLSAMESWALSQQARLPDYLHDELSVVMDKVQSELLKGLPT